MSETTGHPRLRDDEYEWITGASPQAQFQQPYNYHHQQQQYHNNPLAQYALSGSAPFKRPSADRPIKPNYAGSSFFHRTIEYDTITRRQRTFQFSHTQTPHASRLNTGSRLSESRLERSSEAPYTPHDWGKFAKQEELNSLKTSVNDYTMRGASRRVEPRSQMQRENFTKAKFIGEAAPATKFYSPPLSTSKLVEKSMPRPTLPSAPAVLSTPSTKSTANGSGEMNSPNLDAKTSSHGLDLSSEKLSTTSSLNPPEPHSSDLEAENSKCTVTLSNLIDIGSDSDEDQKTLLGFDPDNTTRFACTPSTLADLLDIDFSIGTEVVDKPPATMTLEELPMSPTKNNDLISLMDSQDYTHIPHNSRDLSELFDPTFNHDHNHNHNGETKAYNGFQDLLGDNDNNSSSSGTDHSSGSKGYADRDSDIDSNSDSNSESNSDNDSYSDTDSYSEDDDGFNGLWYTIDSLGEDKIYLDLNTLDVIKADLENAGIGNDMSDLYNTV
ncbi:hypothetical protein BGX27_003381 [Mortierella sp. AM989]|nr:hypothetical protein BGX27_003381 [Mortierella sp. AM989]